MNSRHVAVIGAGIAGLATAFELVKQGYRISLVAPFHAKSAATPAAMGIVSIKAQIHPRTALFAFKMHGLLTLFGWLDEIEEAARIKIPRSQGIYEPYFNDAGRAKILDRVFHGDPLPDQPVEILKTSESPTLGDVYPLCIGSFFYPEDMWIDSDALVSGLETYLKAHSQVRFVDNLVTNCVWEKSGSWNVELDRHPRSMSVDEVILACGQGTPQILAESGFAGSLLVNSLSPMWGVSLSFDVSDQLSRTLIFGKQVFVSHAGRGWFGSVDYKFEPNETQMEEAKAHLKSCAQELGLLRQNVETKCRAGARLYASDRAPLIGPLFFTPQASDFSSTGYPDSSPPPSNSYSSSSPRLFLNTAHHKNGFAFAASAARMVSSFLRGQSTEKFAGDFLPGRFLNKKDSSFHSE